eukprot:XP_001611299.1 aspartyl protease family protein [Babesia bovis T2Bo]
MIGNHSVNVQHFYYIPLYILKPALYIVILSIFKIIVLDFVHAEDSHICTNQNLVSRENEKRTNDIYFSSRPIKVELHGDLHNVAYYYTNIELGTPPQFQTVVVDTGSPNIMLSGSQCKHCGRHQRRPFNLMKSETSTLISGLSSQCQALGGSNGNDGEVLNVCCFDEAYAENSVVKGIYASDYIRFKDNSTTIVPYRVPQLGVVTVETMLIYKQMANGILGLGPKQDHKRIVPHEANGYHSNAINDTIVPGDNDNTDDVDIRIREQSIGDGVESLKQPCQNDETNGMHNLNFIRGFLENNFPPENYGFSLEFNECGGWLTLGTTKNNQCQLDTGCEESSGSPKHFVWTPLSGEDEYTISLEYVVFVGCTIQSSLKKFILDSGSTNSSLDLDLYNIIHTFYNNLCRNMKRNYNHHGKRFHRKRRRKCKLGDESKRKAIPGTSQQRGTMNKNDLTNKKLQHKTDNINHVVDKAKATDEYPNEQISIYSSISPSANMNAIDDEIRKLIKRMSPHNICRTQKSTGNICFSDINEMPSIYLTVKR